MDFAQLKSYLKTNVNTALATIWNTIGGKKYIHLWDFEAQKPTESFIRFTLNEKRTSGTIFGNTGQVNNIASEQKIYILTINIFVLAADEKQNSNHTDKLIAELQKHYVKLHAPELYYRHFTYGNTMKSEDGLYNIYTCYLELDNAISFL